MNMDENTASLRLATIDDADTVATIARQSRKHFLPYLPDLHSLDGDKKFYRNRVFKTCQVWVVEDHQQIVGFCSFQKDWIDHLYFLPSHVGQGFGAELVNKAKESLPFLQLFVFQQNTRAISFYKRHGFVLVKETDGSGNEEKTPDALFEWRRE